MADEPGTVVTDPPAAPAAAPTATPTTTLDWRESLPDELKGEVSLKDFGSVADLAKGYVNTKSKVGDMINIPGQDDTEGWKALHAKLGCPEKPEEYEVPEDVPEGIVIKKELVAEWFKVAHEQGFNRQQAARAIRFQLEAQARRQSEIAKELEAYKAETVETLKGEWGQSYDQRRGFADTAVQRLEAKGAVGLRDALNETALVGDQPFGNKLAIIKAFSIIGQYMQSDEILGKGSAASFDLTPAEASAKIAELQNDPAFYKRWTTGGIPGHDEAVAQMSRLKEARRGQPKTEEGPIRFGPVEVGGPSKGST